MSETPDTDQQEEILTPTETSENVAEEGLGHEAEHTTPDPLMETVQSERKKLTKTCKPPETKRQAYYITPHTTQYLEEQLQQEEAGSALSLWGQRLYWIAQVAEKMFQPPVSDEAEDIPLGEIQGRALQTHAQAFITTAKEIKRSVDEDVLMDELIKFTHYAFGIASRMPAISKGRRIEKLCAMLPKHIPSARLVDKDVAALQQIAALMAENRITGRDDKTMLPITDESFNIHVPQALKIMTIICSTPGGEKMNEEYYSSIQTERLQQSHDAMIRKERYTRLITRLYTYSPGVPIQQHTDFSEPMNTLGVNGMENSGWKGLVTMLWNAVRTTAPDHPSYPTLCSLSGLILAALIDKKDDLSGDLIPLSSGRHLHLNKLLEIISPASKDSLSTAIDESEEEEAQPEQPIEEPPKKAPAPQTSPSKKVDTRRLGSNTEKFNRLRIAAIISAIQFRLEIEKLEKKPVVAAETAAITLLKELQQGLEQEEEGLGRMSDNHASRSIKDLAGKLVKLAKSKKIEALQKATETIHQSESPVVFAMMLNCSQSQHLEETIHRLTDEQAQTALKRCQRYLQEGETKVALLEDGDSKNKREVQLRSGIQSIITLGMLYLTTAPAERGNAFESAIQELLKTIEVQAQAMEDAVVSDEEQIQRATAVMKSTDEFDTEEAARIIRAAESGSFKTLTAEDRAIAKKEAELAHQSGEVELFEAGEFNNLLDGLFDE